jgi:hypothetical protein
MGVWRGVAMDSLKYRQGLSCPTLLRPVGGWPAAVLHPFGYPTSYASFEKCNDHHFCYFHLLLPLLPTFFFYLSAPFPHLDSGRCHINSGWHLDIQDIFICNPGLNKICKYSLLIVHGVSECQCKVLDSFHLVTHLLASTTQRSHPFIFPTPLLSLHPLLPLNPAPPPSLLTPSPFSPLPNPPSSSPQPLPLTDPPLTPRPHPRPPPLPPLTFPLIYTQQLT